MCKYWASSVREVFTDAPDGALVAGMCAPENNLQNHALAQRPDRGALGLAQGLVAAAVEVRRATDPPRLEPSSGEGSHLSRRLGNLRDHKLLDRRQRDPVEVHGSEPSRSGPSQVGQRSDSIDRESFTGYQCITVALGASPGHRAAWPTPQGPGRFRGVVPGPSPAEAPPIGETCEREGPESG